MKVFVEAHGCTQNYGEARLMMEALTEAGHIMTGSEQEADAHVLVTCTVIETTERAMVRRMTELAAHEKPLVVAGCMPAAQRNLVLRTVPRAMVLPPRKWPEIVDLLGAGTSCGDRAAAMESASFGWHDAIVPIEQGCAGRCTYCITRVARGRVSSYPIETLVNRIRRHVERGIREIKLTGQDTAAYGRDSGTNLAELLRAIDDLPGEFRVRVGMADPLTVYPILDELIDAYASKRVFTFLHLPVQSGSDDILAAMKREYTVAEFEEIVGAFRKAHPEVTLSTDAIVGFPGESEVQFEATMELVRRVRPEIVNITRFSAREGTPAAKLPGWVVGWRVKERSRRLTHLRWQVARSAHERWVGRDLEVLITELGKKHTLIGRTQEYRQVCVPRQASLGDFVLVRIESASAFDLRGTLVSSPLGPAPPTGDGLYTPEQIHLGSPVV